MEKEHAQFVKQQLFLIVTKIPRDRALISGRWVYKKKLDSNNSVKEYKARWVARGFEQVENIDYFDTYAATIRSATFRTVFALSAYFNWTLIQLDVTGAFLHSGLEEEIYMQPPTGFNPKGIFWKIRKSLYGLKQAPNLWSKALTAALNSLGFTSTTSDACCFVNKHKTAYVLAFVDDLQITGSDPQEIERVVKGLKATFSIRDIPPKTYLGLQIERQDNAMRLHQAPYCKQILERFSNGQIWATTATPMTEKPLQLNRGDFDPILTQKYQQAVGSLLFLATQTRPDIAFAVGKLGRYSSNPSQEHWTAVKRVFRYLQGTQNHGITFQYNKELEPPLVGYSDADFGGDTDTRRSTSGSIFMLAGGPISWNSKLQSTVTLSTTEAEYTALAEAVREATWIRQLLGELGIESPSINKVTLYEDNQPSIQLAENHVNHARSKHIDIRTHYVREQVSLGKINVEYLHTDQQAADGLTKPLGRLKWANFLSQIRVREKVDSKSKKEHS
jgi:histone deacetylase 1/2